LQALGRHDAVKPQWMLAREGVPKLRTPSFEKKLLTAKGAKEMEVGEKEKDFNRKGADTGREGLKFA